MPDHGSRAMDLPVGQIHNPAARVKRCCWRQKTLWDHRPPDSDCIPSQEIANRLPTDWNERATNGRSLSRKARIVTHLKIRKPVYLTAGNKSPMKPEASSSSHPSGLAPLRPTGPWSRADERMTKPANGPLTHRPSNCPAQIPLRVCCSDSKGARRTMRRGTVSRLFSRGDSKLDPLPIFARMVATKDQFNLNRYHRRL